jgi:hypothetical protein
MPFYALNSALHRHRARRYKLAIGNRQRAISKRQDDTVGRGTTNYELRTTNYSLTLQG